MLNRPAYINNKFGAWNDYLYTWKLDYPDDAAIWAAACAATPTISCRTLLSENFRLISLEDGVAVVGGWSEVLIQIASKKTAEILCNWPEPSNPQSIRFVLESME